MHCTLADGLPLMPVSPLVQIDETLYSVTIAWGYSPTPLHAPLLGYSITLTSCDQPQDQHMSIETEGNDTEITLSVRPGSISCVTVSGRSMLGQGPTSPEVMVSSMSAQVPPPPSYVTLTWQSGVLHVSWQVRCYLHYT